jgi:hypothetical protein
MSGMIQSLLDYFAKSTKPHSAPTRTFRSRMAKNPFDYGQCAGDSGEMEWPVLDHCVDSLPDRHGREE